MRLIRSLSILVALTALIPTPAKAESTLHFLFGCSGSRCDIQYSPGGIPLLFEDAAQEALKKGVQIRIEGTCNSSCVIFASQARKNVCLTKDARMGIHRGTLTKIYEPFGKEVRLQDAGTMKIYASPPPGYRVEKTFFTLEYGADINAWALAENKMPYGNVYVMTAEEASRYWKSCH